MTQQNPAQNHQNHRISPQEVANLAYLNWKHDGCPPGQDVKYWLEAECQLRATLHLLAEEHSSPVPPNGKTAPARSGSKSPRKISLPTKAAAKIKTARTRS